MNYKDIEIGKEVVVTQLNKVKLPCNSIKEEPYIWKGKITKMVDNSRTKVIVKDIDRGKGWCVETKKYKGVKTENGWYLGKNRGFGEEIEVSINDIKYV